MTRRTFPRISPHLAKKGLATVSSAMWLLLLIGCSLQVNTVVPNASAVRGIVYAGNRPVINASVQLLVVDPLASTSVANAPLTSAVQTDNTGSFVFTDLGACPANSLIYAVARGGEPQSVTGTPDPSLALMATLGTCNSLTAASFTINELTTIASVTPLAPYASAEGFYPASSTDLTAIVQTTHNLVDPASGEVGGPNGELDQTTIQKLNTLGDMLELCGNGATAGDGSPCGQLFSLAPESGQTTSDTLGAVIGIAQNPTRNVDSLYALVSGTSTFKPALSSAPQNFCLTTICAPSAPLMSPEPGAYSNGQSITLSDSSVGVSLYYTLDGSTPSASSTQYTGPIQLENSAILRAVAIENGSSSTVISGAYTVSAPIRVSPGTATLSPAETDQFSASVANTTNTAVSWSLSPALGSISPSGIYTAPTTITSAQTVTITAKSVTDPTETANAVIELVPPVSVAVTPGAVTLLPGASQQFSASVMNSTNTAVSWSLAPVLGSISPSGLYTAPATISSAQTVTVTATSAADSTKTTRAVITLLPRVSVTVTPGAVTLLPGTSQQFSAPVANTTNTAISWTLAPALGEISATGLYTAPANLSTEQIVTITATSAADSTKSASAMITLVPLPAASTTFYVDRVNGSDANDGKTPATAFATIAKVNTLNLLPGQTVAFAAGEVWHENLVVAQSGSAAAPITLTSYGTGAQPVITGADTVTGWNGSAPIWYRSQTSNPYLINFSGQAGTQVASPNLLTSANQFAWNDNTLFVYSLVDPTTTVEIPQRPWPVTLSGVSYITLKNIEVRGAQSSNIYCNAPNGCPGLVINQVTSRAAYTDGLAVLSSDTGTAGNVTVLNSTFSGLGGAGITLNGSMATEAKIGAQNNGNTVTDACKMYSATNTVIGSYWTNDNTYCDAIKTYTDLNEGGSGTDIAYNTISNIGVNQPTNYGGGIHFDTVSGGVIEHNTIQNTNAPGIQLEKTTGGSVAQYNLVVNGGLGTYAAGISIRAGDGQSTSGAVVQYNTSYGGWWACGFLIQQNEGYVTATNTTFQKNICNSGSSNTDFYADSGASGAGNSFSDNSFGIANPYFIVFGGSVLSTYSGFDQVIGTPTGSVQGNPMFTNPSAGNFTLQSLSPAVGIGAFPIP